MKSSGCITCKQAMTQIRAALKRRSKKRWSVTTSRGSTYGRILVHAPKSRWPNPPRMEGGKYIGSSYMSVEDNGELAQLFNLPLKAVGPQGINISREDDFRQEYIDRAEGNEPSVVGVIDLYND